MACALSNPLGCVEQVAGGVGKQVAGDVFDEIAQSFATAAKDATTWLWNTMGQATSVSFGGPGWRRDLGITITLAFIIGVGLFLIQVIASGLRRDFGGIGRALRGVFIAWGVGAAAISITESLLAVTDQVSKGIMEVGANTSSWQAFGQKILAATSISAVSQSATAGAVVLLISLVIVMASVVVWAALMIRKLLLIVAAVFAPIAFAGAQSDITSSWVRKWIEFTLALIASKVILVTIFVVGIGVLGPGVGRAPMPAGTGRLAQNVTQVVIGALILCLAGFAPWLALKMVHFAGDSFHTLHAQAQGVGHGARTAAQIPQKFRGASQLASGASSPSLDGSTGRQHRPLNSRTVSNGEGDPAPASTQLGGPKGTGGVSNATEPAGRPESSGPEQTPGPTGPPETTWPAGPMAPTAPPAAETTVPRGPELRESPTDPSQRIQTKTNTAPARPAGR